MFAQLRALVAVAALACTLVATYQEEHEVNPPTADLSTSSSAPSGCASHGEYEALELGLILIDVRHLFGIPGRYEGTKSGFDRYSFTTCKAWKAANGKRVWCWFGVVGGFLEHWALRDLRATIVVAEDWLPKEPRRMLG